MAKTTYKPGLSFGDIRSYDFKASDDLSFSIALTEEYVSISSITVKHEDGHILTTNTPIHSFKVGIEFNLSSGVSNYLWKEAAKNVQDGFQDATECTEELVGELKERCNNTPLSISSNFVLTYGEINALFEEIIALPLKGYFDDELVASAIILSHAVGIWRDREANGCKFLTDTVESARTDIIFQEKLYKLIEELLKGLCGSLNEELRKKALEDSFVRLMAMQLLFQDGRNPAPTTGKKEQADPFPAIEGVEGDPDEEYEKEIEEIKAWGERQKARYKNRKMPTEVVYEYAELHADALRKWKERRRKAEEGTDYRNHDNPPAEFETLRSFARERSKEHDVVDEQFLKPCRGV